MIELGIIAIKNIPIKIDKFLNNLNKCQASVSPTKIVVEPKNFSPIVEFVAHLLP